MMLKPNTNDEYQKMFDTVSMDSNKIVIVDFKTTWCKVCTVMQPELVEFIKNNPDVVIIEFDMEQLDHKEMDNVKVPPTFKFFKAGDFLTAFCGKNMLKMQEIVTSNRN